jgi:hypothetical protein
MSMAAETRMAARSAPGVLEDVRKKLRSLVRLIDKTHRKLLYTDFTGVW